jgi:hypothetical protein
VFDMAIFTALPLTLFGTLVGGPDDSRWASVLSLRVWLVLSAPSGSISCPWPCVCRHCPSITHGFRIDPQQISRRIASSYAVFD